MGTPDARIARRRSAHEQGQIREIGKRFGLATRETSLIVLELIEDYVRNEIEPPTELREAYDRIAATVAKRRVESDAARLAQVVRRFEARVAWWNRDFPKGDRPAPLADRQAGGDRRRQCDRCARCPARAAPPAQRCRAREQGRRAGGGAHAERAAGDRSAAGAGADAVAPRRAGQGCAGRCACQEGRRADGGASTTIAIAVTPAANASAAIQRLQAARADEWTRIYLDERRANETSVGFFLDAAEFFLAKGDPEHRAQGLRALSNLAELDLQNRQVLRLLAYRLQQAGETATAVPIFERVLELAPNEPQSHRDLGLALADRPDAAGGRLASTPSSPARGTGASPTST